MLLITALGSQYTIHEGDNVIGRGRDCDLCLTSGPISRRHATIRWDGQRAWVIDLGSTNGTRLNGENLTPHQAYPLNIGDRVELGGPEGRLEVGVASIPPLPTELPVAPPLGAQQRRRLTARQIVAASLALVLGLAAVGVLFWAVARTPAASPTAGATLTPTTAVMIQTPIIAASPPPLTVVAFPTVKPPAPAGAASSPGASGIAAVAVPKQFPLEQLAAGQIPPINPTTMPELIGTLVQSITVAAGVPPAVSTLVAKLPGGAAAGPVGGTSTPLASGPKRYGAPALTAPADGSSFKGENATVILEWEATANLGERDYYQVIVFYKREGKELAGGTWTKGTAYRVPVWFLAQQSGQFEWQVVIVAATELPEKGGKLGEPVSAPSGRRWFNWTVDEGQQGNPAPGPGDPSPTPKFNG
jgi:hypothetical protein